jgi:hypothetical protein
MALRSHRPGTSVASGHPLSLSLAIAAAVIALMLAATAVLGVHTAGPSYEIAPDPAGAALPF